MPALETSTPNPANRPALPAGVDPRKLQWGYLAATVIIHFLALGVLVPWLFSWVGVACFLVGILLFGQLAIPICYHRQLAHRAFKTPKWLERFFVSLALCCAQETPGRWVAWHRLHHGHSDKEDDLHSPRAGFFWSHFGWLVVANQNSLDFSNYFRYARDILEDPFYMWLEKNRFSTAIFFLGHAGVVFAVTAGITALVYGLGSMESWRISLSVLFWGVLFRTVWIWHVTWSVNSLAHVFGYQTYDTHDDSRNNWLVSLLTLGEGWHNNHHADPSAACSQHRWWEIDPNFYVIRCLGWVGLASDIIPSMPKRRQANRPAPQIEETKVQNERECHKAV